MAVVLDSRADITLELFERVAWGGESASIAPAALERIDEARQSFLRLAAQPNVTVYGVTSGYGDRVGSRLDPEDRRRQASVAALRAATVGEPLPERVTR